MNAPEGRRVLNSQDRSVLLIDDLLMRRGHPGMQCQSQVWFEGSVDEGRLRHALREILRIRPVLASRLVRTPSFPETHWRFPFDGGDPLQVEELPDDAEATVLARAERVFWKPMDLEAEPPVHLLLLRRPDRGDVLLIHFSHVLMDGKAPELLLEDMSAIDRGEEPEPCESADRDEILDWYRRYPLGFRLRSRAREIGRRFVEDRRGPDDLPLRMGDPAAPRWARSRSRIQSKSLDPASSEAVRRRTRETLGFENLTPVLLASAFRTIEATARWDPRPDASLRVQIPVSLRSFVNGTAPRFRNFSSYLRLSATRRETGDREELSRRLASRMRSRLRDRDEIVMLDSMRWLARGDGRLRRGALERYWGRRGTIGFGYHGRAPRRIAELFGSRATRLHNFAPCSTGPMLSINDLEGLHLGLTYTNDYLSDDEATAFLEDLACDLQS